MSERVYDGKGRWRYHTVAFRMSLEESKALDREVAVSGLSKQDYIISCLLNHKVVITPDRKVFGRLKRSMDKLYDELIRISDEKSISEDTIDGIEKIINVMKGLNK